MVERPVEQVVFKPVIVPVVREEIKEVPGQTVYVEKKFIQERVVVVPRYVDQKVPTVVVQSFWPRVSEASATDANAYIDVQCKVYNFVPVPQDVYVPMLVQRPLMFSEMTTRHREVMSHLVPDEQYNTLIKTLNPTLTLDNSTDIFRFAPPEKIASSQKEYCKLPGLGMIALTTGPGTYLVEPKPDSMTVGQMMAPPTISMGGQPLPTASASVGEITYGSVMGTASMASVMPNVMPSFTASAMTGPESLKGSVGMGLTAGDRLGMGLAAPGGGVPMGNNGVTTSGLGMVAAPPPQTQVVGAMGGGEPDMKTIGSINAMNFHTLAAEAMRQQSVASSLRESIGYQKASVAAAPFHSMTWNTMGVHQRVPNELLRDLVDGSDCSSSFTGGDESQLQNLAVQLYQLKGEIQKLHQNVGGGAGGVRSLLHPSEQLASLLVHGRQQYGGSDAVSSVSKKSSSSVAGLKKRRRKGRSTSLPKAPVWNVSKKRSSRSPPVFSARRVQ